MQIHKLQESTRSLMRSSFILTDLNSIVDELIANALDANATKVEITVNLDTFSLTLYDNGDGITFENMELIADRYKSSKTVDDTMRGITSIGYKGEALSSLAQISMLHIISRNKYDHVICSKLMRGGKVIYLNDDIDDDNQLLPHKHGTTVIVKDMFFNLKIRREQIFGNKKTFKKTTDSLHSNIVKWAVAHYDLQFILNNIDNKRIKKLICKSKGYSSPKFVISSLIDPDLIKYLHCFDSDDLFQITNNNDIRIWGVICDVGRFYHNKNWQLLYINRRCIRHKTIYKNIMTFLLKIHQCFKSELNETTNISINSSLTHRVMFEKSSNDIHCRVPWYKHKQNKHHKHPIFAVFIETDPQNIIMENDTKKLHVLMKNESMVLQKLNSTLLKMAHNMYPTLRLMNSWKDEFAEIMDEDIKSLSTKCKERDVIIHKEKQEEEEKLICYDKERSTSTLPLLESCILSTPSSSPNNYKNDVISPSPPWQIARKKQKELYLRSLTKKRNKNKKRKLSETENDNKVQKRQRLDHYFGNDLDEMISTNTSFMDDHFPRIPRNSNRICSKDTESVLIANQQTNDLMNGLIPKESVHKSKTVNGESLFGFKLPHFCSKSGDERIMDIIDGEVKLSSILSEWQSQYHIESNDNIPQIEFGAEDIVISKEDLSSMALFGIGQIDKKWIVLRWKEYILLMDQHAADERVRVERLTSFLVGDNGPNWYRIKSTKLSAPYLLFVEYKEFETLKLHSDWIKKWGFDYKVMEEDVKYKIKVYKTPFIYGSTISVDELRELLCNIGSMQSDLIQKYVPKCIQRVLASKACRSAIKFGDKLNDKQMRNLMKQIAQCRLPFQCAHGRPTLFPIADLKQFEFDQNGDFKHINIIV